MFRHSVSKRTQEAGVHPIPAPASGGGPARKDTSR